MTIVCLDGYTHAHTQSIVWATKSVIGFSVIHHVLALLKSRLYKSGYVASVENCSRIG